MHNSRFVGSSSKAQLPSAFVSHDAETKAQGYCAILFRGGFGWGAFSSARGEMDLLLSPHRKGINPNYSNQKRFI